MALNLPEKPTHKSCQVTEADVIGWLTHHGYDDEKLSAAIAEDPDFLAKLCGIIGDMKSIIYAPGYAPGM